MFILSFNAVRNLDILFCSFLQGILIANFKNLVGEILKKLDKDLITQLYDQSETCIWTINHSSIEYIIDY